MKRLFIFFIMSIFIFPTIIFAESNNTYFTTASNKKLNYEEYETLKNLGYNDQMIKMMPDEYIDRNLTEVLELVSMSSHKIEMDGINVIKECNTSRTGDDVKNGTVTSENCTKIGEQLPFYTMSCEPGEKGCKDDPNHGRTLTTYVFYSNTNKTYKIANYVEWDGSPGDKYFDINAVGFNTPGVVIVRDSQKAYQSYTEYKSILFGTKDEEFKVINYSTNSDHYKFHTNAIGITMNLANGSKIGYNTKDHILYLEYYIKKSVTNTINSLDVVGKYKHSESSVDLLDFLGVAISEEISPFDIAVLVTKSAEKKYDEGNRNNVVLANIGW